MATAKKDTDIKVAPVRKRGRTPKKDIDGTDVYDESKMVKAIEKYIQRKVKTGEVPILKECAFENNWSYDTLMKKQRTSTNLRQSTSRLLDLKEIRLEQLGLSGDINPNLAKFSLKQLGWTEEPKILIDTKDLVTIDFAGVMDNMKKADTNNKEG